MYFFLNSQSIFYIFGELLGYVLVIFFEFLSGALDLSVGCLELSVGCLELSFGCLELSFGILLRAS